MYAHVHVMIYVHVAIVDVRMYITDCIYNVCVCVQ